MNHAFAMLRRRSFLATALAAAGTGLVAGCSQSGRQPVKVEVPPPTQQLRALLEAYAKSGELDSGVIAIREQIEALRKTDSAKADALDREIAKLESAKGAAAVKKQAEAMLGKL